MKLINFEKYPGVSKLQSTLNSNHRFAAKSIERGFYLFGEIWLDELEVVINAAFPNLDAIIAGAKGYSNFALQSMRLQSVFERERIYKPKSHLEASKEVYFNENHMMQEYLPLVAL